MNFASRNKVAGFFIGFLWGRNLSKLAVIYNTDKYGTHYYTPNYQKYFKQFKYKKIKLLEIGVGGYNSPYKGGSSLRMWKRYFPFGRIFSLDIYDKSPQEEYRIKIYKGSQIDFSFLEKTVADIGEIDLIIDDGSHINNHVITSFEYLFPKLKNGGIYVVEDTQTSYWKDFGGDSEDLKNADTLMNFFKKITDSLNHKEYHKKEYTPNYYDENVSSIHFYHNMVFIFKK
ncbi:MAG: class I SAM-dependent methyltransferase [Polaribacter sp.]|uniref:class I SAM-dependent methyltransferase n=1 Tax=Polaribacter sp. TaxID=1920175 RepID=UPI002F357C16